MSRVLSLVALTATTALASTAMAGFANEDAPAWRGDANTMYGLWDTFSQANFAPNFAEAGNMGFAGEVYNFSGTAIIAGSGNIYDAQSALNIHNYISLENVDITDVMINVSTAGSGPDFESVLFQAVSSDGSSQFLDTSDYSMNFQQDIPGFGSTLNMSWSFDLSGIDSDVTTLAFIIKGTGPHMSLDAISTDVAFAVVPAPGALALLGLAGLAGRRRRRH